MSWVPASVINAQILQRSVSGSLIPITLPRQVLGTITILYGTNNITLLGHPRGTVVRAVSGNALSIGRTTSGAFAPDVGSVYVDSIGDSPTSGFSMDDKGDLLGASVGDFMFIQPGESSSHLSESPVGGGTDRVVGGMLHKVGTAADFSVEFVDGYSPENGTNELTDMAPIWSASVIPPAQICENITVKGIKFEAPAASGQVVSAGLVYNLTIEDCEFKGGLTQGLYIQRCHRPVVKRCRVVNCGTAAVGTGYGIEFNTCVYTLVEDIHGDSVRDVVTRNTGTYHFTEKRTRGTGVVASLSDLHGGVAMDYYGEDIAPLSIAPGLPFGSHKITFGNATWNTFRAKNQALAGADVVQIQVNGGHELQVSASTVATFQLNDSDFGTLNMGITNSVIGESWTSAVSGTLEAGGSLTIDGCTATTGSNTVVALVGGTNMLNGNTLNTTGLVYSGAATLSMTSNTVVGGSGTRVISSGATISVWTSNTVNGAAVTEGQGAGL